MMKKEEYIQAHEEMDKRKDKKKKIRFLLLSLVGFLFIVYLALQVDFSFLNK